ncbi:hypothetical protein [Brevibacterium aurantiacum]|uniref:L,D-peptidoglycan transpeptidase YkuD, ErfK/YbiS/YcfS/YnhG family n=1 Tax=Brevibacterium aurantiacum TaxID=273384 RepID=A0A2H1HV79_BREAU|nr:hypothetical protein [Brevibacterium aurantiacum]SMX66756.1 L,D-peptidoglycan transpeptidase YkuD, ErfK/YbiS/YcfS/YnhG family [Brevibacterium aurantiacum]
MSTTFDPSKHARRADGKFVSKAYAPADDVNLGALTLNDRLEGAWLGYGARDVSDVGHSTLAPGDESERAICEGYLLTRREDALGHFDDGTFSVSELPDGTGRIRVVLERESEHEWGDGPRTGVDRAHTSVEVVDRIENPRDEEAIKGSLQRVAGTQEINADAMGAADQAIEVKQRSTTTADVYLCKKAGKRYVRDAGALKANLGYNGTTANKKEGDGKTPTGTFWMREGFGTSVNPGLDHQDWTTVTKDHVWVDGNASKAGGYNTMQRKSDGYSGESLYNTTAYKYAQVIGYNEDRTAGEGSAIFLHKHTDSGKTAGCVSLSEKDLVKTLKWQNSDDVQMVIH